jgi:hypothetical protein
MHRVVSCSLILGSVLVGTPMLAAADSKIIIMTFSAAVQSDMAPPDLVLSNGMRFMGSAIAADGQRIIAMPDMDDPNSAMSTKMGLMHGTHVFADLPDLRKSPGGADCSGKGTDPSGPIEVDSVPAGSDELMAGILCAWKQTPDTAWRSSTIYGADDEYLARIEFADEGGARKSLYVDVSDWARDILSE